MTPLFSALLGDWIGFLILGVASSVIGIALMGRS